MFKSVTKQVDPTHLTGTKLTSITSRPQPDFFYPNPKVYVAQWQQAVSAVKDILQLGTPDGPKLQGPALAGIKPCEWSLDAIFDQGYLEADGRLLKNVSVHHYFVSGDLIETKMDWCQQRLRYLFVTGRSNWKTHFSGKQRRPHEQIDHPALDVALPSRHSAV